MEGIVNVLNSYLNGGSTNEAHLTVARYMLAHYDALPDMRLQDVAAECFTSSASIIRLVRSFGFADYGAFREALRNEQAGMAVRTFDNDQTPLLGPDGLDSAGTRAWVETVAKSMYASYRTIDMVCAQQLAQDILAYRRVFIVGNGAARFFGDFLKVTTPFQGKAVVSLSGIDGEDFPIGQRDQPLVVIVSQHGNLMREDPGIFERLSERAAKVWLVTQVPQGLFNEDIVDGVLYVSGSGSYQADMFSMLGIAELIRQLCWRTGQTQ